MTGNEIRKIVLDIAYKSKQGHIGSSLSIADIIAWLYTDVLNVKDPEDPMRDRFVLSKGHAALALYAVLYLKGWIKKEDLESYCEPNSEYGVHPSHEIPGVEFSTGSLGMGLSFGVGVALGAKLKGDSFKTYVLISDAELNEGSTWEAIMFAGHHELKNLIVIVDINGQQAMGKTKDILALEPLEEKFEAFGWLTNRNKKTGFEVWNNIQPVVLFIETTFGEGVDFMENQLKWHYSPMNEEEYEKAVRQISN